jgi:hypothetical protein
VGDGLAKLVIYFGWRFFGCASLSYTSTPPEIRHPGLLLAIWPFQACWMVLADKLVDAPRGARRREEQCAQGCGL